MRTLLKLNKMTKKTVLQKQFEEKTPSVIGVLSVEYLQTYCSWLEVQVEQYKNELNDKSK